MNVCFFFLSWFNVIISNSLQKQFPTNLSDILATKEKNRYPNIKTLGIAARLFKTKNLQK